MILGLINPDYNKKKKKVLKKSKLGFEIELHIIDGKGRLQNKAPELIKAVKKNDKNTPIIKECGNNFFELTSYPGFVTYDSALGLIHSIESVQNSTEKLGLKIYPFGTYPTHFKTQFSKSYHYQLKEKIIGSKRFRIAPNSAGFHCHYSLPKGVFDEKIKNIRLMKDSKLCRSLVNSYNFMIATDPAMTLFAQSSPFFNNKHISKDMKNLIYRGGKRLKYKDGIYTKLQMFGNLPPYKATVTDLLEIIDVRWKRWKLLAKRADPKADITKIYSSPLDVCWCPVKINKVGTLEHRSMNTNFMSISFAIAVLFKFCLRKIQREFIEVIPSDLAITEPFKLENGILHIPPHSHVRRRLQVYSIYEGYQNKEMYEYTKRFFRFAKSATPKRYHTIIKTISEMIENKKSMSDKILAYAKHKGYLENNSINKPDAEELSIHFANKFPKDLESIKKKLKKVPTFSY